MNIVNVQESPQISNGTETENNQISGVESNGFSRMKSLSSNFDYQTSGGKGFSIKRS